MKGGVKAKDLDKMVLVKSSRNVARRKFGLAGVAHGGRSCCGRILFVYLKMQLCQGRSEERECENSFFVAKVKVLCMVCQQRVFVPMSDSEKCPRCYR